MIDVAQASMVLAGLSVLIGIVILGGGLAFGLFVQREYPPEVPAEKEEPAFDAALLAKRSAAYRLGIMVLIGLAILTGVEYGIAVAVSSVVALIIIGLFKAGLIVQYFMHVSSLWAEEAH
ncbi:MAG: hypothetical protein P8186_22010 [Anaerolineae bacterium]|jgi:hypothetical protein